MNYNSMKLGKNERRIVTKFAPVNTIKEKEFYGFVKIGNKDHILITTANHLAEATRLLKEDAKKLGQELTLVRAFK